MVKLSDAGLASKISQMMTAYQEILIKKKQSGRTEDQSIVPTVTITFEELRKLTNRTRIRTAFIEKLTGLLEDDGMEVELEHEALIVTKPAEDLEIEFDSLKQLQHAVDAVEA